MKVSIITVSYNSGEFISTAINSVLAQSYPFIEYIIVDGGSSDATVPIVQSYGDKITHFLNEKDDGIYDAMNKGLSLATGDIIGILNSDDFYLHENIIAEIVGVFEFNSSAFMVFGNIDFVYSNNLTRPVRFYSSFNFSPWKMRFGFMPAHPATFIKISAFHCVGNYKIDYKIGADFEWFLRALFINRLPFVRINKALVRMRLGGVSSAGVKSYLLSSIELVRALRENKVYSNILFILARLPIKLFQKFFLKG